jgi:hypothetical protein
MSERFDDTITLFAGFHHFAQSAEITSNPASILLRFIAKLGKPADPVPVFLLSGDMVSPQKADYPLTFRSPLSSL